MANVIDKSIIMVSRNISHQVQPPMVNFTFLIEIQILSKLNTLNLVMIWVALEDNLKNEEDLKNEDDVRVKMT